MNFASIEIYPDASQIIVNGVTICDQFKKFEVMQGDVPGVGKDVSMLCYHGLRVFISPKDAYELKQAGATGETINVH